MVILKLFLNAVVVNNIPANVELWELMSIWTGWVGLAARASHDGSPFFLVLTLCIYFLSFFKCWLGDRDLGRSSERRGIVERTCRQWMVEGLLGWFETVECEGCGQSSEGRVAGEASLLTTCVCQPAFQQDYLTPFFIMDMCSLFTMLLYSGLHHCYWHRHSSPYGRYCLHITFPSPATCRQILLLLLLLQPPPPLLQTQTWIEWTGLLLLLLLLVY